MVLAPAFTDERGIYVDAQAVEGDEDTGFVDVAMDPESPQTLYAASYQRRRTPFGYNGGGPGSARAITGTAPPPELTSPSGGTTCALRSRSSIGMPASRRSPASDSIASGRRRRSRSNPSRSASVQRQKPQSASYRTVSGRCGPGAGPAPRPAPSPACR